MRQHDLAFALTSLALILGPIVEQPLAAQSAGVTLTGTVSSASAPLSGATVVAGTAHTVADSKGRFTLTQLTEGPVRVRILRLGYGRLDTTLVLRSGHFTRLDAELGPGELVAKKQALAAEAANVAAGRVDSSSLGLFRRRGSDSSLTFGPFGARLLAAAADGRDPDLNIVLSPVSAGVALSLVLLGARGNTEAALGNSLGTEGLDRAALERAGAAFLAAVRGRTDVQLEIANAVWVDDRARLTPTFQVSAATWRAMVGTLPLASPTALGPINRWADRATHGKITSILDQPLEPGAALFIANAVYFKGKWLKPFHKGETQLRDFTLASGKRIRIPAMQRAGALGYRREPGYQVARLPYRGGRVAMYVILPDSGTAPGVLERRFADRGWPASLAKHDERDVFLVLPKLHVEQMLDLRPLLHTLGADIALDCRRADFQDLAVARAGGTRLPLCIGAAVQKVFLDVDEKGTEAAAVTGISVKSDSAPPPPIPFIVDRPFLFVLRDERSGADLFVGSIRKP
jgi:serine protease inhibitor